MWISLHQFWEELCNFVACEKRCIPSLIGWHAEQEQFWRANSCYYRGEAGSLPSYEVLQRQKVLERKKLVPRE